MQLAPVRARPTDSAPCRWPTGGRPATHRAPAAAGQGDRVGGEASLSSVMSRGCPQCAALRVAAVVSLSLWIVARPARAAAQEQARDSLGQAVALLAVAGVQLGH